MLAPLGLRSAKDRNGKESRSGLTTDALEAALQAYRDAADAAEEAANSALVVRLLTGRVALFQKARRSTAAHPPMMPKHWLPPFPPIYHRMRSGPGRKGGARVRR